MDAALIGCGFIGEFIARRIAEGDLDINLRFILDRHREKVERIQKILNNSPVAAGGIDDILSSDVDIVIEAASIGAVKDFAEDILLSGKDILILSVGAFSDKDFNERIEKICRRGDVRVFLPSGAIGALDIIASAKEGGLEEVELTTIKNPRSLEGAPYLDRGGIDLSKIRDRKEIFSGNAREAIEGFPANVNVAVSLALAGLGMNNTMVRIVADPGVDKNIHEIRASGDFGEFVFRTENLTSPDNPRTSHIAALSAISALKKISSPIKIG